MSQSDLFVIFSHGFGVDKTDRGLFNNILAGLSDVTGVMFDYNQVDEAMGNMTVRPLGDQAEALTAVIETVRKHHDGPISLICHSQGCVVAGLAQPEGIDKVIMLAPPVKLDTERLVQIFGSREGSKINFEGDSLMARSDGSTTTVPKNYWEGLDGIQPIVLYNELAAKTELVLIVANQDHVLVGQKPDGVSGDVKLVHLNGDHDFSYEGDREIMIHKVQQVLGS